MMTAPHKLNLSPGAVLDGVLFDLSIYAGADWSLSVPFYGADGTTAVNVTNARMQVKDATGALLVTPTASVAGNVVTVSILGTASAALQAQTGAYDLFVTRADTGAVVKLLYGSASIAPAITSLS